MDTTASATAAPTAREVEDLLAAAPGLEAACFRLAPHGRGYAVVGVSAGYQVVHSLPVLVRFFGPDAQRGVDVCRRTLRRGGLVSQRCWDKDEAEYLAILGRSAP